MQHRYARPAVAPGPRRIRPWNYSPQLAQRRADAKAARLKVAKWAANVRLRAAGAGWLEQEHSPEQIAARLGVDFADDPKMWVSHETIYQSLYVQGRGALRRDLATRLRTVGRCANHAARTQNGAAGSRHGRHRRPPSRGRRPRRARRLGGW